jgi:nicotinamidase/pyrazinamidase
MSNKPNLLIIDPQVDFCEVNRPLYINGADKDMSRLAKMIKENVNDIGNVIITLDSHHKAQIFHPIWWVDANGNHPEPIKTVITSHDIKSGKWRCSNPLFQERSLEYVEYIEFKGIFVLVIWPEHCLIGTYGHNVVPELMESILLWENSVNVAEKLFKGSNLFTEHYSAVKAAKISGFDKTTDINLPFIGSVIEGKGDILVSGEALSHCINYTMRDLIEWIDPININRMVLLEDACSNVPTFEKMGQEFIDMMVNKGMRISTTDKYFKYGC